MYTLERLGSRTALAMGDNVLSMCFDTYHRYRLVADGLQRLGVDGAPFSVLDVGGRASSRGHLLNDHGIFA
jgi:hypothetical protein